MDRMIRKETCPEVLDLYLRLRESYNQPYDRIADFMTDGALKAIGAHGIGEEALLWASHKVAWSGRYLFWERILSNRQCFSDAFIASIWYQLVDDYRNSAPPDSVPSQLVERDGTKRKFSGRKRNRKLQAQSILTSPYLLDCPIVTYCYCQARKKGWKMLRYVHDGRRREALQNWDGFREDIEEDSVAGFEMRRAMQGKRSLNFCLVAEILRGGAGNIFWHLLTTERTKLERVIPLEEIACDVVSNLKDDFAITVLEMLEKVKPGLIRNFRDALGQNLLWYGMTNMHTCWFHPASRMTPFLIEHGCSPDLPTNIGLSWRFLTDSLTNERKRNLWGMRLEKNEGLSENQPNIWWVA